MNANFKWSNMDDDIVPLTFSPAFEKLFLDNPKLLVRFLNTQIGSHIVYDKSEIRRGYEVVKRPLIHYETNKFNFYITLNGDDYDNSEIFLNPYISVMFALYENIDKTIGEEKIYQLVINSNFLDDSGECKVKFTGKDGYSLNFYTAYVKNIEYYKKMYYDNHEVLDESKLWLLALGASTFRQLYDIMSQILCGDELDLFMNEVVKINSDISILEKWRKKCLRN